MKEYLTIDGCFGNPSSRSHKFGWQAEEAVDHAREQIANLLKYPCRYFPMGCREAFILSKKAAHERDCPFLQLKCPFHDKCSFNGSLKDVVPHLASEHEVTPVCYFCLLFFCLQY